MRIKVSRFKELIIEVSHNCNLSCIMCGFGSQKISNDKFMDFKRVKFIVDNIGKDAELIRLNGRGESTIHPEFVEILEYTHNLYPDKSLSLFTNLSFSNDRILKSLLYTNVQLFISIDSPDKIELEDIRKGSNYSYILKNLSELGVAHKRPFIVFTLQEKNIHRIYDIACFALKNNMNIIYNTVRRDYGIENFIEQVVRELDFIKNQFRRAEQLYKGSDLYCMIPNSISGINLELSFSRKTYGDKNNCPAIENELCILYDGNVTPCNMFNPLVYGNIFSNSLSNILSGSVKEKFKRDYKDNPYCRNCSCLGGAL